MFERRIQISCPSELICWWTDAGMAAGHLGTERDFTSIDADCYEGLGPGPYTVKLTGLLP